MTPPPAALLVCSSCDRAVAREAAWVQCPACLAVPICSNCAQPFTPDDRRVLYCADGEDVGPFCQRCDGVLDAAHRALGVGAGLLNGVTAARLAAALDRLRETVLAAGLMTAAIGDDCELLARLAAALTPEPRAEGRG